MEVQESKKEEKILEVLEEADGWLKTSEIKKRTELNHVLNRLKFLCKAGLAEMKRAKRYGVGNPPLEFKLKEDK